jgi:hypothetical protein
MAGMGWRKLACGALFRFIQHQVAGNSDASADGGGHHGKEGEKQHTG